jgi:MFS family permease
MSPTDERPSLRADRLLAGLLITPAIVGLAVLVVPKIQVGVLGAGMISFGGSILTAILGLAIAATAGGTLALGLVVGGAAAAVLAGLAILHTTSAWAAVWVDASLVAAGWGVGTSIGRRVQHPGHLLPACVVVACADLTSTLSPQGPTHAIASSERALSILAVSFPVPGTNALAPALGVGDLVFIALVLGAAVVHRLPYARTAILCALGTFVAGLGSALLETAVPALVPVGAAVVLGLPKARALRRQDRPVAFFAMLIAASIAAATLVSRAFHRVDRSSSPPDSSLPATARAWAAIQARPRAVVSTRSTSMIRARIIDSDEAAACPRIAVGLGCRLGTGAGRGPTG